MNRILSICLCCLLMFPIYATALTRHIQDDYQFTYVILDTSGDHVTGQTPTIAIKKASNAYWLDFSDSTFKTSGWTNKTITLTEDATNGIYYYTFNPPASETAAEQYIFVVDNSDATYGDHQTLSVEYQNIGTGTSTLAVSDNIGVNWADITNQTATVGLTGTTVSTSQAVASVSGAVGSVTGGVTVATNNDKTGYALSTAAIQAVWDALTSALTTVGSVGKRIADYLDTAVSGVANSTWNATTRTLTALNDTQTTVDLSNTTVNAEAVVGEETAASIAESVLNGTITGREAGTLGGTISDINDATDGDKESGNYTGIEKTIRQQR